MIKQPLCLKWLGIDTYKDAILYVRDDSPVCRAEGLGTPAQVRVSLNEHSILAKLNIVTSDILEPGEAGLSNYAWKLLKAKEGDQILLSHPKLLQSLSYVRAKIWNQRLTDKQIDEIVTDMAAGHYSDMYIAAFLTACAGGRLNRHEIVALTRSMVTVGQQLAWGAEIVVDKHSVGGIPGNRTTLLIVPIVSAFGLTMPKTSSRAITSPAGTADTMEVLAPVDLDLARMRKVVEQEQGCIMWGGTVELSPVDDILIPIERALDLDSEGQLVASILSKKIAAGSTHILLDMPIGATAKVRSVAMAKRLHSCLQYVATQLGMHVNVLFSDGAQPIGRGIGPALEAKDVLAVLQNESDAPRDLRERALTLAGHILEFSPRVKPGQGITIAQHILDTGQAWQKFQAICSAQGGIRELPPRAPYTYSVPAPYRGRVIHIDNRRLARLAKLAGAPKAKTAGIEFWAPLDKWMEKGEPLFTIHSESRGELDYALQYLEQEPNIVRLGQDVE